MANADLEKFAGKPFSFYPPIVGVEHNQWSYEEGTWSEVRVRNTKTRQDLWIPRRFVGEVSEVDEPVMIVGLTPELEYKGGMLIPHRRRVLAMPATGWERRPDAAQKPAPAPRTSWRSEFAAERKIGLLIGGALAIFIAGTFLVVMMSRERQAGGRISYEAVLQAELGLTAEDDYFSVVRKMGTPASERWKSDSGERQYRALEYPALGVTVILMGPDREDIRYIGAKDKEWRNVHSVKLPSGGSSDSVLRALERF